LSAAVFRGWLRLMASGAVIKFRFAQSRGRRHAAQASILPKTPQPKRDAAPLMQERAKPRQKMHASIDALPSRSQAGRLSRADTLKQGARFIDPARGTEKGNGGSFEMGQHQA
jgi:hypothetical protein